MLIGRVLFAWGGCGWLGEMGWVFWGGQGNFILFLGFGFFSGRGGRGLLLEVYLPYPFEVSIVCRWRVSHLVARAET